MVVVVVVVMVVLLLLAVLFLGLSKHGEQGGVAFVVVVSGQGVEGEAAQARGLTAALDGVVSDWPRDALVTLGRA